MSFILLGILNSQAAGAGGAGAYDLLETTVLTSSASSVSFTGLDSYTDYKHLQLRIVANGGGLIYQRFNSDTGSNYAEHRLYGDGSSVNSQGFASQTEMIIGFGTTTTDVFAACVVDVLDFSSSNKNTTVRSLGGDNSDVALGSGLWNNTNAVTSTDIFPNSGSFATGSRFSLYGIKGA